MARRFRPLARLQGDQLRASSPREHAALCASAGTGKTHVLTARVLRLLLADVDPASILCLTFTKAGAAEMADRIHARLAHWVRLDEGKLRKDLFALEQVHIGEELIERARTLFARVLDAAGGGLRIQTIHAFAQSLLASFPAEAGLAPGFRPIEGREEQLLARETLAELLVRAERGGDLGFIRDVQSLSHRLGEAGAEAFLRRCATVPDAMESLGAREGIEARLRRHFGLPSGDIEAAVIAHCGDDGVFDLSALRQIVRLNTGWGTKGGHERASMCERWLAASATHRAAMLNELHGIWATQKGELRAGRGQVPPDPDYAALAAAAFECCARLLALRTGARLTAALAGGLRAGQTFAFAYREAKAASGLVDFNDLIRLAERLLLLPGIGEWVRYKLDQEIDHILVDEAQDTNEQQWNIVRALALEFFAGQGAVARRRTVFTVGDYKQAIFGFQGTEPASFNRARAWFEREARGVGRDFLDLSMDRSFRSSPAILAVVDGLLANLGHEAMGLPEPPNPHDTAHGDRAGSVTLWQPFTREAIDNGEDEGEEGWISDSVRHYASALARQIRAWLDNPFRLSSGKPVRAEDILILVRRRSDLAALIVARLHSEGVPVAGVDRLMLSAPLAVQDLLSAVRFAVQPLDDLNLASLLVSPLFGWSQDDLFALSFGRSGALWPRLREHRELAAKFPETLEGLGGMLAMADYATPYQFLEALVSGPLQGRRKLIHRLGQEARDPIEELLASALEFEAATAPSLQRFLDWFARGDVEIVRDPSTPLDAVRVMTVHGSKGLQAPVVILADACGNPDRKGGGVGGTFAAMSIEPEGPAVPIFRPRKDELIEPLATGLAEQERLEREEYWRLLYVALTRAEERLYLGGALGPGDRNGPAEASWHKAVESALQSLGCSWSDDSRWGRSMRFGDAERPVARATGAERLPIADLPAWVTAPAPPEARPPRPLVPSLFIEDDLPEPPPSAAMRAAADRGRLLHQLFERLPAVAPEDRASAADRWLERAAGIADLPLRQELVEAACTIVSDPQFADVFGAEALAEAPIAAVTPDGSVVTGTVDRLLVTPQRVRVVDFKTGRRVPPTAAGVPIPHLRQMAAYVAALEVIFPGRQVDAALLYTSGPRLHALGRGDLEPYLPGHCE